MDKSLFTACRYTGKERTEGNASEFRVCSKCGGITHKTVGAPRKTTYDLTVDNKVATTTEIIPETDLLKQEAFRCSYCAETLYDYSELDGLVKTAQRLYDNTEEGDRAGNVPEGAKDTLLASIESANDLIAVIDAGNEEITLIEGQDPIPVAVHENLVILNLRHAIESFTQAIIPFPDKTALLALIAEAQELYDEADEAEYVEGAKDTLLLAIDDANDVARDIGATVDEVEDAVDAIETAISTFNDAKIPDKTALSDLIDTAQDLYDGSEDADYQEGAKAELLIAIGEATTVLEDDTATTSEVEEAVTALETAISTFNDAKINP